MAKGNNNWLWWTVGGVAFIGVGVGAFLYFRKKSKEEQLKNNGVVYVPPVTTPPAPTTTTSGLGSGNISVTVPFKNEMEGNAFRNWVNNTYSAWATANQLDRKGSYNNSYIQKAWAKYGVEYSEYQSKGSQSASNSGVQDLQKVVTAMNGYAIEDNSSERVQFLLYDGFSDKNIRVNFTPSGYFWIEADATTQVKKKFDGSWSFANNQFTVKLADGSFNGTDPNLAGMLWTMAKQKFPDTVGFSNANGLDNMLTEKARSYVDSQDSML
jgi:hypothetical protein